MQINNNISILRDQIHLTQEDLAKKVEVSRQTIIAMEKGDYSPSLLLAFKLSKVFKLSIEKIFYLK